MATASFHARLERIQNAQAQSGQATVPGFHAPAAAGVQTAQTVKRPRRRSPLLEHIKSIFFGLALGCLVAVALIGLSLENSPWGPGTDWHAVAFYPTMAGLGLAPLLLLISLFNATSRPGFALFSLGYLTGIVVLLFI
ncbi:MAG: hypothetical protein PVI41_00130 [Roseobacter sp.]|jgi:hypothetical protein